MARNVSAHTRGFLDGSRLRAFCDGRVFDASHHLRRAHNTATLRGLSSACAQKLVLAYFAKRSGGTAGARSSKPTTERTECSPGNPICVSYSGSSYLTC